MVAASNTSEAGVTNVTTSSVTPGRAGVRPEQSSWRGLLDQEDFIVETIGIFGARHPSCTLTKNDMQGNISEVYISKYPFSLIFKTNARSTNYGWEVRDLKILEL